MQNKSDFSQTGPERKRANELNLAAPRKMQTKGVEIRVNIRAHTRLFVACIGDDPKTASYGAVLLGSFDFNFLPSKLRTETRRVAVFLVTMVTYECPQLVI